MSTDRTAAAPVVPTERLDSGGWELQEETTDTVFQLPTVTVEGHTLLYEDAALRERVHERTGVDQTWRFFFATALTFSPPLAPGLAPLVKSTVASEAQRTFAKDLRERGFSEVDRGRSQTIRIDGDRARLSNFRAIYPLETDGRTVDLQVAGWLAVWNGDGFRLAGGAYPEAGFQAVEEQRDAGAYRDELLSLIRDVR
ncbi:hypothetical protein [Halorarius litoreus]|uniref:hypothetical protein n=1 Tax=Halorarius litoreus TaxID=2962676 RepID=UPI0020CD6A5F|nr:hypothetical protein [Halorarius litoreus]